LSSWRADHIERDGIAVVVRRAVEGDAPAFDVSLAASDGEPHALILGRHSRCDILVDDPEVSLRQAAIVLWPGADPASGGGARMGPRAVVIDLHTSTALRTRRGAARRISSGTALQFAIGAGAARDVEVTVLVAARDQAFPLRQPDELEAHLVGALIDDEAPAPASVPESTWEHSVVFRRGDTRTVLPPDELVIEATAAEIARGIVLGRYERCRRTAALRDHDAVSRVHALVFAADGALWITDTASSAGTELVSPRAGGELRVVLGEGRRIARLSPDARLFLAGVEAQIDAGGRFVR
jgi:hypothetical protein